MLQINTVGIGYCSVGPLWHRVRISKSNTPFLKKPQAGAHRMSAGFHDNETALGDRLQFVRRQQCALHHLQALTGVVLPTVHGTGQDGAASKCFGQSFRSLAVRCETTEDGILAVVLNDFAALPTVVLFKLCKGLDDGYQSQAARIYQRRTEAGYQRAAWYRTRRSTAPPGSSACRRFHRPRQKAHGSDSES